METPSPRRELLLRWLLAVGCFALLLFFFSPNWGAFLLGARVPEMQGLIELRRGANVAFQVNNPGDAIPDPLHGAIQWRLLFPVLAKVFGLPLGVLFSLAHVGCVAVLGYVITVLRRAGVAWAECALSAVLFGSASWFFASVGWLGYFDSWVVLALLVVAFSPARWAVWLACLAGPWIDERFVLGAPLALLCAHVLRPTPAVNSAAAPRAFAWQLDLAVPAALLAGFIAIRLGLLAGRSAPNATVGGYLEWLSPHRAFGANLALGIWEGLRAGWIFAGLGVALVWSTRGRPLALALAGTTLAVAVVALATAQDFSRSLLFVSPVVLLGLVCAARSAGRWKLPALRTAAVAAVLLPAHLVMSDQVKPVFYLYHELAALQQPPPIAMPELYELRAIDAMQAGDFAFAERQLSLAIALGPQRSSPLKQRGVFYASNGRWPDALRDFTTMVEVDPTNPESWFFRAQAKLATGDTVGARTDLERAFERAPAVWKKRGDVARFMARLQQAR